MNVTIKFAIPNSGYDQEYADQHHDGEESPENSRDRWAEGYEMEEVVKIEEEMNATYVLKGKLLATGEDFEYNIPQMRVYRFFHGNGDVSTFAVSEELIGSDRAVRPLQKRMKRFYFIDLLEGLSPHNDFAMPSDGILIAKNSIPKALLPS